jgi:hypothetical protein
LRVALSWREGVACIDQAHVSYLAGKYPEGLATINQVLENYGQNSNPKYISFSTALTVQGLLLNKLGHGDEAEKVLREAVKLREENLPEKHFMTALSKGALGEVLSSQKRFAEAEPLLVGSYQDLQQSQAQTVHEYERRCFGSSPFMSSGASRRRRMRIAS